MDIQTKKLTIIEHLLNIQDEELIDEIKSTVLAKYTSNLKKISEVELVNRAERSNHDIINGNVINQKKLENESTNW